MHCLSIYGDAHMQPPYTNLSFLDAPELARKGKHYNLQLAWEGLYST